MPEMILLRRKVSRKIVTSIAIGLAVCSVLSISCDFRDQKRNQENMGIRFQETKKQRDQRMSWWREAKFGMFIHWGVYAVPAGVYKGKKVDRTGEWIMQHEQIPVAEYREYARQFIPTYYDPEAWVKLAREAGMKYLVITAKHHEGFSLYDSKVTDWDVVDASPYGKDLLKPLAESCHKHGIKLGFYYSHALDWVHPGGEAATLGYKPGGHWDPIQKTTDMDTYFRDIVVPQVREILTNYGKVDILWWDGGGWYNVNRKRADMILAVLKDYPDVLMNNRLGGDYPGDWTSPEQYIPATGLDYDWETCMTMNKSWGYTSWDTEWKSTETLLQNLIDIISKGGNYLLNIGPKADGTLPEASVARLKAIGKWMDVNGESIYGTTAGPFERIAWGRCSKKDLGNGVTRLYLHVFDWPKNGRLLAPRVHNDIKAVFLLADENRGQRQVTAMGDRLIIDVPVKAPDTICSVVALDIAGAPMAMNPPRIEAEAKVLYDHMKVTLKSDVPQVRIRYSLDGATPTEQSAAFEAQTPITLTRNALVKAALFRNGERVSEVREQPFTRQAPRPAEQLEQSRQGLEYQYFEGMWSAVPNYSELKSVDGGVVDFCDVSKGRRQEHFGMRFTGYIKVPRTGVYRFYAASNDGCGVSIGDQQVLKSPSGVYDYGIKREDTGIPIVLEAGFHPITVDYFQRIDHAVLELYWSGPDFMKQTIAAQAFFH